MRFVLGDFKAKSNSWYANDKNILKVRKLTLLNNSFSRVNLIYIKTESSNRITCSFLYPHKLSLANNICKMLFKCILFTSLLNRGTHLIIFFDWDIEVLFLIQLSAIWKLSSKKSMVESFLSTLEDLPEGFPKRCLQQLLCREPVSICFCKKELHSRRYLRNFRKFKNTQD